MKEINQQDQLVKQYELETGQQARISLGFDHYKWSDAFVLWLTSRPACGKEQRRFLTELERKYKFRDLGMGVLVKKKNWRYDVTEIMQKDFDADIKKVIEGK